MYVYVCRKLWDDDADGYEVARRHAAQRCEMPRRRMSRTKRAAKSAGWRGGKRSGKIKFSLVPRPRNEQRERERDRAKQSNTPSKCAGAWHMIQTTEKLRARVSVATLTVFVSSYKYPKCTHINIDTSIYHKYIEVYVMR